MFFRSISTVIVLTFTLASCDSGYVPLEDRMSWQDCENASDELNELLTDVFPSYEFGVEVLRNAAKSWRRPAQNERYTKIKDAINLCSIKQTFEEQKSNEKLVDYDALYVSLVMLDVTLDKLLDDLESEQQSDRIRWRSNVVAETINDLKSRLTN